MYTRQLSINMSLGLKPCDAFKLGHKAYYYKGVDTEGDLVVRINSNRKKGCTIQNITLDGIVYYYQKIKGEPITAYRDNDETPYRIRCKSIDGDKYYYIHTNVHLRDDSTNAYTKIGQRALTNNIYDAPIRTKELRSICANLRASPFVELSESIPIRGNGLTLSFAGICSDTKQIMICHISNIDTIRIIKGGSYVMFQAISCIDGKKYYFGNNDLAVECCPPSDMLCYTSHRANELLYDWMMPTIEGIEEIKISEINCRNFIIYLDTLRVSKDGILVI